MNQLTPWRSRMESLFGTNPLQQLLQETFDEPRISAAMGENRIPAADVAETENEYIISLEMPGMRREDIQVELTGDRLTVSGERKQERSKVGKRYHRMECSYGAFSRTFELPLAVRRDPESVVANFHDGMLEIHVAKVEPQPVAKIPVRAS